MSTESLERKLAAILYADVAGYSRLTGEDEEGTHRTLRAYLEVITSHIQEHTGRVVHYAGDAVLAEFSTVSEALSCAVDVQSDFNERNRHLTDDRKVEFRIGVNLGEVIVDQDEIYGDGVNVAARLESLADPGGIAISESVRSAIGRNLPLDYAFMGEQNVKNIAEPVRAYRVLLKGDPGSKTAPGSSPRRRRALMAGAAALIFTITGGALVWLKPWSASLDPASGEVTIVVPSDKASIAVLPFANISDDPEQEYFSDGLTDDLITDLSKISGLFVIARNSVFMYKDKPVTISQVADELGVHYVLEGSVRRAGDKVRINAQLIDGKTGGHVWAERYDGDLSDVFSLQDQVTHRIVTALEVQLTPQEQAISTGKGTQNIAAYDAFLRGFELLQRKTPENAVHAIRHFERALQLDPNFSRANVGLAQIYWEYSTDTRFNELTGNYEAGTGSWGGEGYINDVAAWEYLKRAGDAPVSLAHALVARMLQRQRRFEEAMQEARKAVALGPSDPIAYDALIEILIYADEVEKALNLIDESIRLDPGLPGEKLFLKGLAYYSMGRFEDALASIERARSHNPVQTRYAAIQAVILAELGRVDEAMAAFEDYRSALTDSFITLNWVNLHWPFQDIEQAERLAKGLLKAGLHDSLQRSYVVSPGNRLRSDELRTLLADRTVIGTDWGPAGHEEFELSRDENLQIVSQPKLTYFHAGTTKTRVENDLLCDPWRDFGDYCVAIYRNPDGTPTGKDEYVFFTLFGVFTFSAFEPTSR